MKLKLGISIIALFFSTSLLFSQKYGATPKDSLECIKNLSLYGEFYKNKAYEDAIGPWRMVFLNCPKASQNTYVRGTKLVNYFLKKEKDPERRMKYVDTLMMVYDNRIKHFPVDKRGNNKVGYIQGRKAVELFKHAPKRYEEVYNLLKESVGTEGNKSSSSVLVYYLRSAVSMVKNKKAEDVLIIDTYDIISDIVDYNMKNNKKDSAKFARAIPNIDLAFAPYATCPELIRVFGKKFEANPTDVDLLTKITKMLYTKGCTEEDLFFKSTEALHKLEPSAHTAFMMGKMCLNRNQYTEASTYFLDAVKYYEDIEDKANCFYLLGDAYRKLNDFASARKYVKKVIELKPNDGMPYLFIGELYAASAKSCGTDEISSKAAYWAAVDKFKQARGVDSSAEVKEIANKKIATYRQFFPKEEKIFFYNLSKGDTYEVGCWINEKTVIR